MPYPGYHPGNEPVLWWKVAMHLDEAQLSLANAMVHNIDDPTLAHALYARLREGQAILFQIFHMKGLLPGRVVVPMPEMPPPRMSMPGMPESSAIEEPAVTEADHAAISESSPEQPAVDLVDAPEVVVPAAIVLEPPTVVSPAAIVLEPPTVVLAEDPGAVEAGR